MEQELHPSKGKRCDVYVSAEYRQLSCQSIGKGKYVASKEQSPWKVPLLYLHQFLCVLPVPRSYAYKFSIR